jgi:hypothetical protein
MARRSKSKSRRRKPAFSVLNALESLTYAEIIARGTTGGGLGSFITGDTDLAWSEATQGQSVYDSGLGVTSFAQGNPAKWSGTDQISLGDFMTEPGKAVSVMAGNFQSNIMPMALGAFGVNIGFRIGKRLLRQPINNINRNIMKPALGAGIKL